MCLSVKHLSFPIVTQDGATLAFMAAMNGHVAVLELLWDCGANLETPDNVRRICKI